MLSPAELEVVGRDPSLPGLGTLLDPARFANALRGALPDRRIDAAELAYLRYKPATNCLAAYRVQIDGEAVPVHAKAHRLDSPTKWQKAREGCPTLVLAELGITAFAFPNDAKLRVLSRLGDRASRRSLLERTFRADREISDKPLQTLSYKPERRYVGRYRPGDRASAVLKFYTPADFRSATVGARAFESRETLRIAPRCGGSKRHRILAFDWLDGRPLRELLADADTDLEALASVGAALSELHAQASPALDRPDALARATPLRELAETIGFLCPALAQRASSIVDRIAARLSDAESGHCAIHGDFYDKQILLERGGVALLDLDQARLGDPRRDLGLFIAHLVRDELLGWLAPARVEQAEALLLHGYQESIGAAVPGVDVYVAEGLFRLAHHPFRNHEPDWPIRTEQILARAQERLARAR